MSTMPITTTPIPPLQKLLGVREELSRLSLEREEIITGLLLGLLAGQHVLILGPPGTDKSRLVRLLSQRIQGAQYFGRLLTKFTQPDEIFGPLDVLALERGEYRRITTHRLPVAHLGFLDEVFKSSSAILNTLLELMNERTFTDGTTVYSSPLHMIVGASNELPNAADGLDAFADRFLLRYQAEYLTKGAAFDVMLQLPPTTPSPRVTLTWEELAHLREMMAGITINDAIRRQIAMLRKELRTAGILVSDRRWRQSMDVLRASALLRGAPMVTTEDFGAIIACCWNTPEQLEVVRTRIQRLPNYLTTQLQRIGARTNDISTEIRGGRLGWLEARTKLSGLLYEMHRLLKHADPTQRTQADSEALVIKRAITELRQTMEPPRARGNAFTGGVDIDLEDDPIAQNDIDHAIDSTLRDIDGASLPPIPTTGGGFRMGSRKKPGGGRGGAS
ncbi:AAA family ATPase [Candidatus Uhrbacteria bacterium]|nr:AAA family ATPase [Candidatus Uhrbacteria bacterium]